MEYVVEKEYAGKTVREIIKRPLCISAATLKHLKFIDNGIMLNGNHVTVRAIVNEGDILSLATEDTKEQEKLTPVDLPLDIAYEDTFLVVPNKPANMPTHPSRDHYDDTVANALAYRYEKMGIPFVFRPINRLDRNTSGLLLIARDRLSANTLSDSMRKKEIKKQYVAILDGVPKEHEGIIDTYIRRTEESIIVRENCKEGEGGDRAVTEYKVLLSENGHSVVYANPITGRTHQIRVHFAGIDCSITGDDMYGHESEYISRHALHSHILEFPHPKSEELISIKAPLPEDMLKLLSSIFSENAISSLKAREPSLFGI
ncbi:MAG: RluA family pseudouridine synthase [Ruminococcaceae bacterium]|nr:RluA family pseudouridine synthase [Oscillospiraceae bacterium]